MSKDLHNDFEMMARSAGALETGKPMTPELWDLADHVIQICAKVADQGGQRKAMYGAVHAALDCKSTCNPTGERNFVDLVVHDCASQIERRPPWDEAEDYGGDIIRAKYVTLSFGA